MILRNIWQVFISRICLRAVFPRLDLREPKNSKKIIIFDFYLHKFIVHKSLRIFSARHWLFVWISIFKKKTIFQKIRYSCISDLPGLEEFIRFPVSRFLIWNRQEFNTADYKFKKAHYCHELLIRQELTWRRGAHRTTGVEAFRSLQLFRSKITKNANDQSPIKDLSIYIGIFMNGGVEFTCL